MHEEEAGALTPFAVENGGDVAQLAQDVSRLQAEVERLRIARAQDRRLLETLIQHLGLSLTPSLSTSHVLESRDLYQMDKVSNVSSSSNSEGRDLFFPFLPQDPAVDLYGYSVHDEDEGKLLALENVHKSLGSGGGGGANATTSHNGIRKVSNSKFLGENGGSFRKTNSVGGGDEEEDEKKVDIPNYYDTLVRVASLQPRDMVPEDTGGMGADSEALAKVLADLRKQPLLPIPPECKWLLQFQAAVQQSDPHSRAQAVLDYGRRFIKKATEIGEVILSEISLPRGRQSIPPIGVGGVAGGLKYMYDGIMFKRPNDPRISGQNFLYGGGPEANLERATKAAANDLRGADSYFRLFLKYDIPVIVPIQVLLEANGHRLVAMPWLPIGGESSKLVYGSADGGKSVHDSHPAVTQIMKFAGYHLHLAGHNVSTQFLYAAGDVEVHHGADGRLYLVDLARALPPEDPRECKHLQFLSNAVFFRSLRPEFTQHLQHLHRQHGEGCPPLSPDALTNWGACSSAPTHNARVLMATRYLLLRAKQLADWLVRQVDLKSSFSQSFHRWGIPLRHLAYVRNCIEDGVGPVGKINVEFKVECTNLVKKSFLYGEKFTLNVFLNSSSGVIPLGAPETQHGKSPAFDQVFVYSGPLQGTGEVVVNGGKKVLGKAMFSIAQLTNQHTYCLPLLHPSNPRRDKRLREKGAQVILCVQSVSSIGLGKIRKRELLIEMVARCLKHFLRWDLQTAIPSTEDNVIARFINLLLFKDTQSNGFWSVKLPHDLRNRFGSKACSDREAGNLISICRPSMREIIELILNATAVRVDQHALAQCLLTQDQSELLFQPRNVISRDVRWKSLNFLEELMLEQTVTEASTRVRSPPEVYLMQLENTVRLAARFDDSEWIGLVREVIHVAKSELELSRGSTKKILLQTITELRLLWHRRVAPRSRLVPEITRTRTAFIASCMRAWQLLAPFWAAVDECHLREMLVAELKCVHSEFGKLLCSTAKGLARTSHGDLTRAASLARAATMMTPSPSEGARSMTVSPTPLRNGPISHPLLLDQANANVVHELETIHDRIWGGPQPMCVLTLQGHRAAVGCLLLLPPHFNASVDESPLVALNTNKIMSEVHGSPGKGVNSIAPNRLGQHHSNNEHDVIVHGAEVKEHESSAVSSVFSQVGFPSPTSTSLNRYDTLDLALQDTFTIVEESSDNMRSSSALYDSSTTTATTSTAIPTTTTTSTTSTTSTTTTLTTTSATATTTAANTTTATATTTFATTAPTATSTLAGNTTDTKSHFESPISPREQSPTRGNNVSIAQTPHSGLSGSFINNYHHENNNDEAKCRAEGDDNEVTPSFEAGRWLVSGSEDATVRVWDLNRAICVTTLRGHKGAVRALALHGGQLVSGSADRSIVVWRNWQVTKTITLEAEVSCLLSVWNNVLVSGGDDGCVRVWDSSFNEVHCLRAHTGAITALCLLRANVLCSAARDDTIRLWGWEEGSMLAGPVVLIQTLSLKSVALSLTRSPSLQLLSGHADCSIMEWLGSGTASGSMRLEAAVNSLCILPATGDIVSGSDDGLVKVTVGGRVNHVLKGHAGGVRSVIVGTGGQLISSSQDCSIKLWA